MRKIFKYLKIWWLMSRNSFVSVFYSKIALTIFLVGKILRFIFFFTFIYFLLQGTKTLAGFTFNQVIFFFLTFNLIDVVSQFLFREVYRFRPLIVSGDFDLVLAKPVSALFRSLLGGADVIDLITIPPLVLAIYLVGRGFSPTPTEIILYLVLVANGLLIAAAFHIAVLGLAILTTEIDHAIMIYRDIMALGRLPVDIYKEPVRSVLTFLVPVAVMVTLPAKAFMSLVSPSGVIMSLIIGIVVLFVAIKLWGLALKSYTSASS